MRKLYIWLRGHRPVIASDRRGLITMELIIIIVLVVVIYLIYKRVAAAQKG